MPGWLGILIQILGSGIIAGFVVALSNHKLQQRRDRKQEAREAQRAWVAHQRQLCLDLLRAVNGFHSLLLIIRSLHDSLESRLAAKDMLEAPRQQMQSLQDTVLRLRSELDLEPNVTFQAAIDRWGDAATAYEQALERPMSSRWNPVRLYLGKTPQDEIDGLADDYKAGLEELRAAVREYKASLELPAKPERRLRLPGLPRPHVRRQDGAPALDRDVIGVTAEMRDRTHGQHGQHGHHGQHGQHGQRQEQSEVAP